MSVIKLNQDNINEVINSSDKLFVKFGATWCGPCKVMDPIFAALSEVYHKNKFASADISLCMAKSSELNIVSVPTLIVFSKGKEVNRFVGFKNKQALEQFIEQYI